MSLRTRLGSFATSPTTSPGSANAVDPLDNLLSSAFDANLSRVGVQLLWSFRYPLVVLVMTDVSVVLSRKVKKSGWP